jgi:predicted amidohydrolase YtcJ
MYDAPMKPAGTLITLLLIPFLGCTVATMQDGTIYTAATVVAGPDQRPEAGWAVFVRDGLVREIGPRNIIISAHSSARAIDLGDATILPGLTDAHGHLDGLGHSLSSVDLTETTSFEEVIERVRKRAASAAPGEWIQGRGWDQNDWSVKEFPTAAALDAVVSDRPVWITRIDGHAALANTAAMRMAGITAETPDPSGGRIIRNDRGEASGVFVDAATDLVERVIPPVTFDQRKRRSARFVS